MSDEATRDELLPVAAATSAAVVVAQSRRQTRVVRPGTEEARRMDDGGIRG